ncbi:sce7726 family protein [Sporolactobacillus terrae]|uniref:sce7726 family protein n=1 Tax=Sporolactobacillus terrae TaxID=269673 RepID=UPI00048CF556|nr:sce7726 family protein [Sporolactobacillus terrae]
MEIQLDLATNSNELNEETLVDIARDLYHEYNPFLFDANLWYKIKQIFPDALYRRLEKKKNYVVGHKIFNDFIMKYYPAEYRVKYNLIKRYLQKSDETSFFELNIGDSRLDIGRINGKSHAYEIKTELDNLEKLPKQLNDYLSTFEYIYVVIHPKHLKRVINIVPDNCGVVTYRFEGESCKFSFRKKAEYNSSFNSDSQLNALTVKELNLLLKKYPELAKLDRIRKEQYIKHNFSKQEINAFFKKALKNRYTDQWTYLQRNFNVIYPIDIQMFFKTQADPKTIYYKKSTML